MLVRLAGARQLLAEHHSAQRQPADSDAIMGDVGKKTFHSKLAKDPTWECSGCGRKGNWHRRAICRCGRDPPAHVCRAQRLSLQRAEEEQAKGRSSEHGQRRTASYADVAKGGNKDPQHKKLEKELEAVRKQLAAEKKEKEELIRAKLGDDKEDADGDADLEDESTEDKDARIQTLAANLKGMAAICGEQSQVYLGFKSEHDRLVKERRESKPLKVQLGHVERKLEKAKARLEKIETRGSELAKSIKELTDEQAKTDEELVEALSAVSALE